MNGNNIRDSSHYANVGVINHKYNLFSATDRNFMNPHTQKKKQISFTTSKRNPSIIVTPNFVITFCT